MAEMPHAKARVIVLGVRFHGDDLRARLGGCAESCASAKAEADNEHVAVSRLGDGVLCDRLGSCAPAACGRRGSRSARGVIRRAAGGGGGRCAAEHAGGGEPRSSDARTFQKITTRAFLGVFHSSLLGLVVDEVPESAASLSIIGSRGRSAYTRNRVNP